MAFWENFKSVEEVVWDILQKCATYFLPFRESLPIFSRYRFDDIKWFLNCWRLNVISYLSLFIYLYLIYNFLINFANSTGEYSHLRWGTFKRMRKKEREKRKRKGVEGFIARYRYGYLTQEFVAVIVVHCAGPHFFRTTGDVQYLSMKRDLRAKITTGVSGGAALILRRPSWRFSSHF